MVVSCDIEVYTSLVLPFLEISRDFETRAAGLVFEIYFRYSHFIAKLSEGMKSNYPTDLIHLT